MNLSCFRWTTCCRFKFINYWYAKQKSFNPTEFMVRNIKGLRHRIAKIKGLEYCWQRLIPLTQNTYSNSDNSVFQPSILIRFCQRILNVKVISDRSNTKIDFFSQECCLKYWLETPELFLWCMYSRTIGERIVKLLFLLSLVLLLLFTRL